MRNMPGLDAPRTWLTLFALYFSGHTFVRLAIGGALSLDEAESFLMARDLAWGYGPQPPLYVWLQWLVFQLTGANLLGLALLKNLILFATASILFSTLRTSHPVRLSGLAVLSLLTVQQFSWESQRDLSHTCLVNMLSVMTISFVWRLRSDRHWQNYSLLGIAIAAGMLAKFNYIFIPVAALGAAIMDAELRRHILPARMLITIFVALCLVIVPLIWIYHHPTVAFSHSYKLNIVQTPDLFVPMLIGIGNLAVVIFLFLLPPVLIGSILWWRYRLPIKKVASDPQCVFYVRTMAIALIILVLFIVLSKTTNFKDRWLQPVLIFAPPALSLWLLPNISKIGLQRYLQVVSGLAVIIYCLIIPDSLLGRAQRAAPFDELLTQLNPTLPSRGKIFTSNWIGGNILYLAPQLDIYSTEGVEPLSPGGYLIWETDWGVPRQVDEEKVVTVEAPYRFGPQNILRLSAAPIIR